MSLEIKDVMSVQAVDVKHSNGRCRLSSIAVVYASVA